MEDFNMPSQRSENPGRALGGILRGETDASHAGMARMGMQASRRARSSAARARTCWMRAQG
jgi:hypothetical protein